MSILLYRDLDGRDIQIKNPTQADWLECCRIIGVRNKAAFDREFLRGMHGSAIMAALADRRP